MTNEKEKKLNYWLNIAGILWLAIGLVSIIPVGLLYLFFAIFSRMNGFSILSLISFPIVCIGTGIGIRFVKNKYKKWLLMLPVLPIIFFFAAQVWMNMSSCGTFDCRVITLQEQGNATNVGKCALPVVDGGDGLKTTGCGVLEVGVTATGIISSTSEAHNWQFSGQKGDYIGITIQNDGKACPVISILDSSGSTLDTSEVYCPDGIPGGEILWPFFPPTKDTYILRFTTPKSPGAYWVQIEKGKDIR